MWFLSPLFTEGLLQKPPSSSDLPLTPRPWRHIHTVVNSDARSRSIQISSQNIRIRR